MISSLCSFLSADSESAMIIKKTNFSYLLQAISVFYLQKHPHATAISIVDLKISLETSQEIFEKKFQKVDDNLSKQKKKNMRKTLTNLGKTTTSFVRDWEISKTDLVVII